MKTNTTARVSLTGKLDILGAEDIGLPLATLSGRKQNILLDLSGVTFLASIGIRHLVTAAKAVSRRGGQLIIFGSDPGRGGSSRHHRHHGDHSHGRHRERGPCPAGGGPRLAILGKRLVLDLIGEDAPVSEEKASGPAHSEVVSRSLRWHRFLPAWPPGAYRAHLATPSASATQSVPAGAMIKASA